MPVSIDVLTIKMLSAARSEDWGLLTRFFQQKEDLLSQVSKVQSEIEPLVSIAKVKAA